jgi:hypothetical protein
MLGRHGETGMDDHRDRGARQLAHQNRVLLAEGDHRIHVAERTTLPASARACGSGESEASERVRRLPRCSCPALRDDVVRDDDGLRLRREAPYYSAEAGHLRPLVLDDVGCGQRSPRIGVPLQGVPEPRMRAAPRDHRLEVGQGLERVLRKRTATLQQLVVKVGRSLRRVAIQSSRWRDDADPEHIAECPIVLQCVLASGMTDTLEGKILRDADQ